MSSDILSSSAIYVLTKITLYGETRGKVGSFEIVVSLDYSLEQKIANSPVT